MSRAIRIPSMGDMPEALASATCAAADRLRAAGHQAWLVGGAVRDLALGLAPHDADVATEARPEEVETLFDRTVGVGRAFGTVLVLLEGTEVQVTTFRSERGYSDARRPDEVRYGANLEEDAARRDFTCNALYLDPATDELRDPSGGLADLRAGRIRCVGDAGERFREDGLRLLRLARFAAAHGLAVEPATRTAAGAEVASLGGVSAERVHSELVRMATGPDPGSAVRLLRDVGALARVFPGMPTDVEAVARLPRGLEHALVAGPHEPEEASVPARFFAALLGATAPEVGPVRAAEALDRLRPPTWERTRVVEIGRVGAELRTVLSQCERGQRPSRSRLILLEREPAFDDACLVLGARDEHDAERLRRLPRHTVDELRPEPLLRSGDLAASSIPRGPRWGELLREAERLQLDGVLRDRETALAWLAARADGEASSDSSGARGRTP